MNTLGRLGLNLVLGAIFVVLFNEMADLPSAATMVVWAMFWIGTLFLQVGYKND